ncbi:site-specific integrase [Nocardioides sp. LHD-245]|uniref:tyrosine-type recombinase/integrase n=1 Tax=Nocardioides sp. LHD-245 TaxID=3051387 RepID=UPI0027E0B2FE|nr:site-specific integrase [Nocardioides sp. LHD-245]
MATDQKRRSFGQVTLMRSGRHQARYTGPDGKLHTAPSTFEDKETAQLWLRNERILTESPETWEPPKVRAAKVRSRLTFGAYSEAWLAGRKVKGRPLAARTLDHYQALLDEHINPTFADVALTSITPEMVDHWYELCAVGRPTTQAHAYSLLRTILGTAVDRGVIKTANPAKVRGGGSTTRAKKVKPATLAELEQIVGAMPDRHRLMVLLASWCALRFGELAELRRKDVDTRAGVLHVRRGVVRSKSAGVVTKAPKSDAGVRDVAIPPHVLPMVRAHLLEHTAAGRDGLLFATSIGEHLAPSTFYGKAAVLAKDGSVKRAGWGWYAARQAAGREDLRFHDLRHTGAVLAAQTGATLAELMGRLGHSTPAAALRYQHAAAERDQEIARRLSEMAQGVEL